MIEEIQGDYIQWLRGFYHVAKTGSFSAAAVKIGRNQPAVSHQIKCLEDKYGVTLFDRSDQKLSLTTEGRLLFDKAIAIFEIIESLNYDMGLTHTKLEGTVRVVATHAVIHSYLPDYVNSFLRLHPNVKFDIHGGGAGYILEQIRTAEADFGFLSLGSVPDGLVYNDLFSTNLVLLAQKKGPFSVNDQALKIEEIVSQPFIFFPRGSTITPLIEDRFAKEGLHLDIRMVLNNFESVKKFVEMGVGVTIIDDFTLTDADYSRLSVYNLDHLFEERRYGMVTRKTRYLSPTTRAFMHSIKPDTQI